MHEHSHIVESVIVFDDVGKIYHNFMPLVLWNTILRCRVIVIYGVDGGFEVGLIPQFRMNPGDILGFCASYDKSSGVVSWGGRMGLFD